MSCLEAALAYTGRGWAVFPLWGILPGGRCACGRAGCDRPGKHPIGKAAPAGLKDASTDPARIRAWWRAYPDANVGLATGRASGLIVVDVDGPAGLEAAAQFGGYPAAPTARTGKGWHIYLRLPGGDVRNRARFLADTDLRGSGGYVVAPPSRHASGAVYAWEITPDQAPLPEVPGWLLALITRRDGGPLAARAAAGPAADAPRDGPTGGAPAGDRQRRYAEAIMQDELAELARQKPGARNDALNRAAYNLGRLAWILGRRRIEDELTRVARKLGMAEGEIARTIKSGLDAGMANPREIRERPEGGRAGSAARRSETAGKQREGGREGSPATGPQLPCSQGVCDPAVAQGSPATAASARRSETAGEQREGGRCAGEQLSWERRLPAGTVAGKTGCAADALPGTADETARCEDISRRDGATGPAGTPALPGTTTGTAATGGTAAALPGTTTGPSQRDASQAGTPALPGTGEGSSRREEAVPLELLAASADDEGNARCVAAIHAGAYLYVEAYGWLRWTGTHYSAQDAEGALERTIVETLMQRQQAALDARRDDIVKRATPTARHVKDTKFNLRSLLTAGVDEFDRDPDLLNCLNGVVHLPTGTVTPHRGTSPHEGAKPHGEPAPQRGASQAGQPPRFTYCVPLVYDPAADRRAWLGFLEAAVDGGPELLAFLQQAVGYSLTGHTSEECLFYIHGPTRAGKGTFQETLGALLPKPLAYQVDFATFTARRDGDANNFDLAPLKPARLVFAGESNKYQTLNPGKIKQLTGGDDVFCAHKFRVHFTYRPQYKIWLLSNHPINADVDDDALWCRVRVIEFPHSMAGREDKTLKRRLREPGNLAGVLAWAIEGAMAWYQGGRDLKTPPAVEAATKKQREALDYVSMWLEECTTTHWQEDGTPNPAQFATNERLYSSYENWCRENGVEPKKQRGLSDALKVKGYRVGVVKWLTLGAVTKAVRAAEGLTVA